MLSLKIKHLGTLLHISLLNVISSFSPLVLFSMSHFFLCYESSYPKYIPPITPFLKMVLTLFSLYLFVRKLAPPKGYFYESGEYTLHQLHLN